MGLKKSIIEALFGTNTTVLHLYIHEAHANASDSNPGTDPNFPLETLAAADAKTPTDTSADLYWHMGPHSGTGYAWPPLRQRTLRRCNWYIVGDGGGNDALARTVLATGTVSASTNADAFLPNVVPAALEWSGKSLRWTSGANSGAGFNQQVRTIMTQNGAGGYPIVLAAPCANSINPTDGFEVFVSTVNFLLPDADFAGLDADVWLSISPLFTDTGTVGPEVVQDAPMQAYFGSQVNCKEAVYLININLSGAVTAVNSHVLHFRNSAIVMHGVTNDGSLGDTSGTGFYTALPNSEVRMGFDIFYPDTPVALGVTASTLGPTDSSQWLGWGYSHLQGNLVGNPNDVPFQFASNGTWQGYAYATTWLVLNARVTLMGNSAIEGGSMFPGFGLVSAASSVELYPNADNELLIAAIGGSASAIEILNQGSVQISSGGSAHIVNDGSSPTIDISENSQLSLFSGNDVLIECLNLNSEVVRITESSMFRVQTGIPVVHDSAPSTNVLTVGSLTGQSTTTPGTIFDPLNPRTTWDLA